MKHSVLEHSADSATLQRPNKLNDQAFEFLQVHEDENYVKH